MTANQLIQKLQEEVAQLSTGDIPIVCNNVECDVDVRIVEDGGHYFMDIGILRH